MQIIRLVIDSVSGNNGTYFGNAVKANTSEGSVAGKINTALDFVSSTQEYIAVPNISGIESIAMWMKLSTLSGTYGPFQVSPTNYLKVVNGTKDPLQLSNKVQTGIIGL